MTSTIFIIALLALLLVTGSILLFARMVQKRSATSSRLLSSSAQPEDTASPSQLPFNTPTSLSPTASKPDAVLPQQSPYDIGASTSSEAGANHAIRNNRSGGSFLEQYNTPGHPPASTYMHSRYAFARRVPAKSPQDDFVFRELEQAYERGMQATYDPYLDATHLILTNVVMNTPAEVDLAFRVCTRKIQTALRSHGKERAALLVDIAGLVIGGEATQVWGQSLKVCWDKICSVVGKDQYLAAHYNSKASVPSQEQLQEKIRRIQIMTSAVLNDFQSNIFDTREEAVAFLQRMRQLKST